MKPFPSLLRFILILFITSFFASKLKAQTPIAFPKDSIEFYEVMDLYMSNARKEGKDFMKQFKEVWYGGYFSEKQRAGVYAITNKMLT